MLEPFDEAAAPEDIAEEDGAEVLLFPQPVIAVPTTIVVTPKPAMAVRASSIDIPSLWTHASDEC
ncbi:MAG TPA: hypothetical protein VGI68_15335 [Mycobacterium sp.]